MFNFGDKIRYIGNKAKRLTFDKIYVVIDPHQHNNPHNLSFSTLAWVYILDDTGALDGYIPETFELVETTKTVDFLSITRGVCGG